MKICITGSGNIKPKEPQDNNILGRDFMTGQMARE